MPLSQLDPFELAGQHPIIMDRPAPDFFEGALLGNGGLGAVVTTRPDAVLIHFGHNNVWDIRVDESNAGDYGTFDEVFARIKEIADQGKRPDQDPWYQKYHTRTTRSYEKPYPRPFPCGSLLLGFDRREAELLGHRLDISTGLCRVTFRTEQGLKLLEVFVEQQQDRVWLRVVDENGQPCALPFNRVKLIPDPRTPSDVPEPQAIEGLPPKTLAFLQTLPYQTPDQYNPSVGHPKDRAFRLSVRVSDEQRPGSWTDADGITQHTGRLERELVSFGSLAAVVELSEGLASEVMADELALPTPDHLQYKHAYGASVEQWKDYWRCSGVALDDDVLEETWYRNLYFLNCSVKAGVTCPGLFANWSYKNIGTNWHGDYHMNYNTQQPFWVTFSSNHLAKHLPYVDLVHHLLPISRKWARDYYGLRGAYFPHSAYPTEMNTHPYPAPDWGWEVCETPWTVQGLWWHYLYSMDKDFLAQQAFEPIREAVLFLVDYMTRDGARGKGWKDDSYHVFPTVVPELYGLTPNLDRNFDCLADLTLIRFVFKSYLASCATLNIEEREEELVAQVRDILDHFPEYPTAESERGQVFVSVPGEDPEMVYNCPVSTMSVFPGEEHGLHSPPGEYNTAVNTYTNQRNEGGNDLVFLNLQGARLGMLDFEKFKNQVKYCLLPNGTCADMVLQVGGRYRDNNSFEGMANMGVWFENFALPVVINECLLQSYNGLLRFFPNWPREKKAEFRTLRTVGGFLVSAEFADGEVQWIEVTSEAGSKLSLILPWPEVALVESGSGKRMEKGPELTMDTVPGELIRLRRVA